MSTGWTELFADFEQNLNEWLARAVEPSVTPPPHQSEPPVFGQFEERLKRLQAHLDKAQHHAEQALLPLTTDIQSLAQWLERLNKARLQMAESVQSTSD